MGVFPRSFDLEPFWFVSDVTLMRVKSDPMERRIPQVDMSLWLLSEKTKSYFVNVSIGRAISSGIRFKYPKSLSSLTHLVVVGLSMWFVRVDFLEKD